MGALNGNIGLGERTQTYMHIEGKEYSIGIDMEFFGEFIWNVKYGILWGVYLECYIIARLQIKWGSFTMAWIFTKTR